MLYLISLAFLSLAFAQEKCNITRWYDNDFPDPTTQSFRDWYATHGEAAQYFDNEDFADRFPGRKWESVFYSDVDYYSPLGFRFKRLGPYNDPTACFEVSNVQGYKVELMIYTLTPRASLCVADMDTDAYANMDVQTNANTCGEGKLYKCFLGETTQTTLRLAVWCETNCEDNSDIDFLYRFRRSGTRYTQEDENPEMWCMMLTDVEESWPDAIESATPGDYVGQNANLFSAASTWSTALVMLVSLVAALLVQ
jgi:hypothetical protein